MPTLRSNTSFIRLFLGRLVTNAGDSLYFIGSMWLIYELTGSSFYTGLAGFLVQLPSSVQFLYGPLVDRWKIRPILVATQLLQGLFVLAIPFAAMTGHLSVGVILAVIPILSLVNKFVYPAQTAALPQIVDDDQLVRANSLFSTAYQGVEVAFNAIGGLILTVISATTLFLFDSITFAIAAILFFGIRIPEERPDTEDSDADKDGNYFANLREGIGYVRGSVLLSMMIGVMVANFGAGALLAVLPAFADTLGGPGTYGLMMAALAGGNVVGAVAASLVEDKPYGVTSIGGFLFSGLCLFAALIVPGLPGTLAFLFVSVVPIGTYNVMFSSLLQSVVADSLLGRVSSVESSLTMVMLPVGNLLGGAAADVFTPAAVMYVQAGLLVLLAVYFLVRVRIRSLPAIPDANETTLGLQSS